MRDFIYRLKHLNSRCQPDERFRDDQLLDRFINGMNHKELYNSMITRGITTWDNTITAVIQLEDNLEMKDSVNTPSTASTTKSTKDDAAPPIEQVVARYLQRMGYVNRNQPRRRAYLRIGVLFDLPWRASHERVPYTPPCVQTPRIPKQ